MQGPLVAGPKVQVPDTVLSSRICFHYREAHNFPIRDIGTYIHVAQHTTLCLCTNMTTLQLKSLRISSILITYVASSKTKHLQVKFKLFIERFNHPSSNLENGYPYPVLRSTFRTLFAKKSTPTEGSMKKGRTI